MRTISAVAIPTALALVAAGCGSSAVGNIPAESSCSTKRRRLASASPRAPSP
jgi:hypothetical protein